MPGFTCLRKCYVEDRLYKAGDVYQGEKAPTRSFEGYVEKAKAVQPQAQPAQVKK
jgi:hypothetical protein